MARPKIIEVDYYRFRTELNRAAGVGERLEPTDKDAWKEWVRSNEVREAAFLTMGSNMYDELKPVILTGDNEWQGYYLVSTVDEACLKWGRAST